MIDTTDLSGHVSSASVSDSHANGASADPLLVVLVVAAVIQTG